MLKVLMQSLVVGQHISTPPTFYTESLTTGRIWNQHLDAKTNTIFGIGSSFGP